MMIEAKLCRPKGSNAPSWEYYVQYFAVGSPFEEQLIRCDRDDLLNALGSEGWELASVVIRPKDAVFFRDDQVVCYFKRRVA